MPFAAGERVGDYEVVKALGAGGMGEVYQVRHVISGRLEAMKVLLPNLEGDSELADRFLREIKVQASLSHPNIAALYTAVKQDNKLLMLMEFVEGTSIEAALRGGPLSPEVAAGYVGQVLDALAYAHSKGVVHRDIKPANIMVTPDGEVKLMDFGIARSRQDRKLTNTGQTVGSLYYMSPEQIRGEELDARSDLYSLGVTLYEMVTGKRPFDGTSEFSIMAAHLHQNPVPPVQVDSRVTGRLNEIILTAIAKEQGKRFQNADAFAAALRNKAAVAVEPPPAIVPEPAPAPGWGRWAAVVAALLFVGLAASQITKRRTPAPEAAAAAPEKRDMAAVPEATPQAAAPAPAAPTPKPAPVPVVAAGPKADPVAPASPTPAPEPKPAVQPSQPVPAEAPAPAAAPPVPDTAERDALQDRKEQLDVRADSITRKMRSLELQQAAQGVNLRSDVKSDHALAGYWMNKAEQQLQSGNLAGAKASLKKAEDLLEKLERILGI